jgi:hypothetical protein
MSQWTIRATHLAGLERGLCSHTLSECPDGMCYALLLANIYVSLRQPVRNGHLAEVLDGEMGTENCFGIA